MISKILEVISVVREQCAEPDQYWETRITVKFAEIEDNEPEGEEDELAGEEGDEDEFDPLQLLEDFKESLGRDDGSCVMSLTIAPEYLESQVPYRVGSRWCLIIDSNGEMSLKEMPAC